MWHRKQTDPKRCHCRHPHQARTTLVRGSVIPRSARTFRALPRGQLRGLPANGASRQRPEVSNLTSYHGIPSIKAVSASFSITLNMTRWFRRSLRSSTFNSLSNDSLIQSSGLLVRAVDKNTKKLERCSPPRRIANPRRVLYL